MLRALATAASLMLCLCGAPAAAPAQPETPGAASEPAAAPAAAIPFRKDPREVGAEFPVTAASLVLLALAAWGALYALRRYGFLPRGLAGTSRRIRLIEALRLDGGVTLYLVAADDHTLLLGRCGNTLIVAAQLQRNAAAQGGPPEDRT